MILENILSESGHYEVINAGVPGYGTAQEMLLMKELTGKKVVGNVLAPELIHRELIEMN